MNSVRNKLLFILTCSWISCFYINLSWIPYCFRLSYQRTINISSKDRISIQQCVIWSENPLHVKITLVAFLKLLCKYLNCWKFIYTIAQDFVHCHNYWLGWSSWFYLIGNIFTWIKTTYLLIQLLQIGWIEWHGV